MNSIEKEWRKILKTVIENGVINHKDDSEVLEILGYHAFIECPMDNFFVSNDSDSFLRFVKEGWFDAEKYPLNSQSLYQYIEGLHDNDIIKCYEKENGFVYSYPERLFSMRIWDEESSDFAEIDQFEVIIERLMDNPGTNRAVAHFYNCGIDRNRIDIPCLQFLQATIRENELVLHVIFRSNDIFGAWPSNMFFIMYIGLLIKDTLVECYPNLTFKGIDYHVTSAHIYKTDLELARGVF